MKITAIYARVSTQEQAKEGYSIGEQVDRLEKYCDAMGWKCYQKFIDAGYSGGSISRPALLQLIDEVKAGKIERVVVFKLDRLSRSQKDTLNLIEDTFLKNSVDFISISENFDTSTAFGRAMVGILAVFAQLEREQIKERVSIGREARAKDGYYHGGGKPPVGYDYIDGKLVVNPYEKIQIEEIYNMFLHGESLTGIMNKMYEKGYRHKCGAWNKERVKSVLSNPVYTGKVTFNGITYEGNHEAIISPEMQAKTAARVAQIAETHQHARRRSLSRCYYLSTLITCGNCGALYAITINGKYKYYSCNSRRKKIKRLVADPNCKNKIYRVDVLEKIVFDEISKLALEPDRIKAIQQPKTSNAERADILRAEISKISQQRERIMELYSIGGFTAEEIQQKAAALNDQRDRLTTELDEISASVPSMDPQQVQQLAASFEDVIKKGTFEEVRYLLEMLIDEIIINGEDITIKWRFS